MTMCTVPRRLGERCWHMVISMFRKFHRDGAYTGMIDFGEIGGSAAMIMVDRLTRAYRRDGQAILGRQGFQNICGQLHRLLADKGIAGG